jgi:hypothetical protein
LVSAITIEVGLYLASAANSPEAEKYSTLESLYGAVVDVMILTTHLAAVTSYPALTTAEMVTVTGA